MELAQTIEKENKGINHNYKEMDLQYDESINTLWFFMRGKPRPTFTTSLLQELTHLYKTIRDGKAEFKAIDYLVVASGETDIYNLGGDLAYFRRCVELQDAPALKAYAYSCISLCYENTINLNRDITTISLMQGSAYGGGFEAALSCNIIIAEKGIKIGFPEILFNLFPGMGAYTYLSRRVEPYFVEQMISSGRMYTSDELYERGIIDILTEPGEGVRELNNFIKKHRHQRHGHVAMQKARLRTFPITLDELRDISDIWVDAALKLTPKDLKVMDRLVNRQSRLSIKKQLSCIA
ncbi:MAG: crotonase/enoyl-CoA hydratase family protein [Gammaproteobacteria bacterium]